MTDFTLRSTGFQNYVRSRSAVDWGTVIYDHSTNSTASTLTITRNLVYPTNGPYSHWYGFTLRCLSTAVEGEESIYNLTIEAEPPTSNSGFV